MRGRKLLDQTLPPTKKEAGTLVFLLERVFEILLACHTKVKSLEAHLILNHDILSPSPATLGQNPP